MQNLNVKSLKIKVTSNLFPPFQKIAIVNNLDSCLNFFLHLEIFVLMLSHPLSFPPHLSILYIHAVPPPLRMDCVFHNVSQFAFFTYQQILVFPLPPLPTYPCQYIKIYFIVTAVKCSISFPFLFGSAINYFSHSPLHFCPKLLLKNICTLSSFFFSLANNEQPAS